MEPRVLRSEFPILASTTYMISNSLGAMPRGVYRGLETFANQWATRGVRAWHEGWWEMPVTVGDILADILGAPHGSITMHQNVSIAESVVLSCFEFTPRRNKVVYTDMNFPSDSIAAATEWLVETFRGRTGIACELDGGQCPAGYRCGCGGPGGLPMCTCHKECARDDECTGPNETCGCSPTQPTPRFCVNACFCLCGAADRQAPPDQSSAF
jgi:hypothetical protein